MYVAFFTEHSYFEVRSCVVVHLFLLAVAVEFHSIPEFDYPLTCWRMLYLYLLFGDYEYSHYIYLHTDFCVNTSIQFTWVILRSRTAESDAKVKVKSLSRVWLFATPWTVAYQAPPSTEFSLARVLEWFAISFSRVSSWLKDWAQVSCILSKTLYREPHLPCEPPRKLDAKGVFIFLRNCHSAFQSDHTNLHFTSNGWEFLLLLVMPAFNIARCFDFRNSSRCVLVSYCGFCFFQMKNDLMHLFIFIFVICLFFFGKVTVQNFAQY